MKHKIFENNTEQTSISVTLNDEALSLSCDSNIQALLRLKNISVSSVALVRNGQVLPKSRWQQTLCSHGDQFEVFALVAGG